MIRFLFPGAERTEVKPGQILTSLTRKREKTKEME